MANKKISELPAASTPLAGTELVELVQGGVNVQATAADMGGGSGGHVIEEEGTPLTQRANLNFVGAGVTAADAGGKTVVTANAATESQVGSVELATAAETLTGTSTTLATHPAGILATYPIGLASINATGTVISFAIPQIYGLTTAVSGNVTASHTGAIVGMNQIVRHNSGTEPTFGSEFKLVEGSRGYVTSVDNFIFMIYYSSTKIQYSITQEE